MLFDLFFSLFLFALVLLIVAIGRITVLNTPNCHTGGDRHNWYGSGYGQYMACGRDERDLPGQSTCASNNGLYNKERGWDYRRERSCLACDRREYHAGYAPTGKLDEKGKPETAAVWKVVPGHEGHITNYGYANYHTPGQRYDADGYRI